MNRMVTSEEHRRLVMDALKQGAYDCPGDCGLSEKRCLEEHPLQWVGVAREGTPDEVTFIEGPTSDIADVLIKAYEEAGLVLVRAQPDELPETEGAL